MHQTLCCAFKYTIIYFSEQSNEDLNFWLYNGLGVLKYVEKLKMVY